MWFRVRFGMTWKLNSCLAVDGYQMGSLLFWEWHIKDILQSLFLYQTSQLPKGCQATAVVAMNTDKKPLRRTRVKTLIVWSSCLMAFFPLIFITLQVALTFFHFFTVLSLSFFDSKFLQLRTVPRLCICNENQLKTSQKLHHLGTEKFLTFYWLQRVLFSSYWIKHNYE